MWYFMLLEVPHIVDKAGGKAVDRLKKTNHNAFVSPYLRTPLRSFEEAERARERARLRQGRGLTLAEWLNDAQAESPPQEEAPVRKLVSNG